MIVTRKGTHQGSKHLQFGFNNQDGLLSESFTVPAHKKRYHIGIVCDGCTGLPGYSKTEVGAGLLPVFAFGRCQELICSGLPLTEIPRALFQACTEFLRDLAQKVMPANIFWNYPEELRPVLRQQKSGRMDWNSTMRFRIDYLSATILGFITDEKQVITFTAGDGIVLVNNDLTIIDQNDQPDYPAASINNPSRGFDTNVYDLAEVQRLAICCDGLQHLMCPLSDDVLKQHVDPEEDQLIKVCYGTDLDEPEFVNQMFEFRPEHILGLQILLNNTYLQREECMTDDCTAVTLLTTNSTQEEE